MSVSLSAHHARVLANRNIERAVASRLFELPESLIDDGETFRLVEIADKTCHRRRAWLNGLVECQQQFNYSHDAVRYLCQADHAFTVLLISGDDRRRIYTIRRDVRALLPGKIIVPVLNDASSEVSADLIKRGADDVLHCSMAPLEGVGRLGALLRRREWALGRQAVEEFTVAKRRARMRSLSSVHLTPMEERILAVLAEREGRVVSYRSIASRAAPYWDERDNMRSLQVTMCRLRRKLARGVWIENQWGHGYALRLKNLGRAATGGTHAA